MSDRSDSSVTAAYAQLLSLAVHEFRTPASVVGGYLRMLHRDADLGDRQRRMVNEAEKSCARLVALIDELSEVSKLDAGTAAVNDETFDLFSMIQEVAEGAHEAEDRGVRVQASGEAAGAMINGDLTRLRAAFGALLRAVAREQPGASTVVADRRRLDRDGKTSAVIVVAEEQTVQPAYNAAPAAFEDQRGGLGLALPIARRVIERHGGQVWSPVAEGRDQGPGRGAIVVSLPLLERSR